MSSIVAPLPTGAGVTAISEHRPRHDPDARHAAEEETPGEDRQPADDPSRHRPHQSAPPPPTDEPPVPAETLFATALLANALLPQAPSAEEMKLRTSQGWLPPESPLRLKDKLI